MLRVCEKLRVVDAKSKGLGLVRTETDYLRALQDAMANMDRCVEVEVLKSLGDVNLEKGRLDKSAEKIDRAIVLYRTALLRCNDADVRESLEYRYSYAEKLRIGKRSINSSSYESRTNKRKIYSLVKVAEKFQQLERRLATRGNAGSLALLLEYTRLVVEGIVNSDNVLEVEAIKSLGDVYLKRGTETRDTTCLTKATALYNTALARCEGVQGRVTLIHRLLYTARIRQKKWTGKKMSKRRVQQQQQQRYVSRDLPITSPSTDVREVKGHQSMSYEEYLATGDRALADGKLDVAEQNFASALRLIHNPSKPDQGKEVECLCSLGAVYVQQGERTKEGRRFTQAAALYNAAIARTDGKKGLAKRLQQVERSFLHNTANVETKHVPSDSALCHKKRLQEMRTRAKSQLQAIDQQHNPYQYDEDDPAMITVETERAEAVKARFKNVAKDRQSFIHDLVEECIAALGPPPCKYAFIGLGSQATELVTPYSDLEFAILIEEGKDNDDTRRYFLNLTHYLHLKVINLGETILPAMAIPSLNDFLSEDPDKDWFFDSVTPRGFAFDGFMPWASKTPFGRDKTKIKAPVSLIQTPVEMAKFQLLDVSVAEGYHLSDILRRVVFLTGEEALVSKYLEKLHLNDVPSQFLSGLSTLQILLENGEQFTSYEPTGQLLNVKKDIYRVPGIAIEVLALCCQINLASVWDIIEELKDAGSIQEENATHLKVLTSISAELRLRTYLHNGGQQDSMSPLTQMKYHSQAQEISDATLTSVFHIPDVQVLFRYYCRAIPLKKCIPSRLKVKPKIVVLESTIIDVSHECRARISGKLHLYDRAKHHWEAALTDVGSDKIKRAEILLELGRLHVIFGDITTSISLNEQSLSLRRSIYGHHATHPDISVSLNNLGLSWNNLGDHKKAISYYEQSLSIMKTIHGENMARPDVAQTLNNLGTSWIDLGDCQKAISYIQQSLLMRKTFYGENTAHPDIVSSLNNLGLAWSHLGDHKKAISYHEQSLTIMNTIYGENTAHPDIAKSLHNIGTFWSHLGEHKKAISYYEKSEMMYKAIYGENTAHPGIATTQENLGSSWSFLGDHKKALSHHEQALIIKKLCHGENTAHPAIARTLSNLGSSWSKLGDHKKAISFFEQSLTMMKTIYGENTAHPVIAASLNNLGISCGDLGYYEKAISYYEQSLSMMKTIYGENTAHQEIADSLANLGISWSILRDHNKAISYYEQSLTIMKNIYGKNTAHPGIAASLYSLGSSWDYLGDQKKAISYFEMSLMIRKTIHGENTAHQDIAGSLNNLGSCWGKLGDYRKALSYYEQSLSISKTICGENTAHPDIALSLQNLGMSWSHLGDHKKAISYFEQSLSMKKAIYGENTQHPDISALLNSLGISWNGVGDHKKAISYHEQALVLGKTIYGENTAHPDIVKV
uniref:Protein-PII uridylyltransferase N-terminal domain-containing protein n=1 Tax=Branchiostoma floridae TaxID=7739 RepID=C3ZYR1_BRAFL|eukprot:XP_002586317.1 hypothetical protein BRAFLDRAFT_109087 [Branchiostoma floridae]